MRMIATTGPRPGLRPARRGITRAGAETEGSPPGRLDVWTSGRLLGCVCRSEVLWVREKGRVWVR